MTYRYRLGLVLVALGLWPGATFGDSEDVAMGRDIAREYCVQCHDVEAGGAFKEAPPSFAAIARYRTSAQIRERIVRPLHAEMPRYSDYMIGGNIDDMVAYIVSLDD